MSMSNDFVEPIFSVFNAKANEGQFSIINVDINIVYFSMFPKNIVGISPKILLSK